MDFAEKFRVAPGAHVNLAKWKTDFTGKHLDKEHAQAETQKLSERMGDLQYKLYAENQRSLLVCLQAMDAGGKDGTIRHVLAHMNPQSCRVTSFKVPTHEEAAHDFLWRIHRAAPGKGEIAVFNRSHYEDVLVVRVHELVPKHVWRERYALINDFEEELRASGTTVLKFFLHISPEEQLRRFKQRLDDPKRQWKISEADYAERPYWDDYMEAYEETLRRTSTKHAPWFVIPADQKWFRNLAVSAIIVEALEGMRLKLPNPTVDLEAIARKYHAAARDGQRRARKGT